MASCVSLRDSTACPAFNASSISTSTQLRGLFPFLQYVSNTASFDDQFRQYISTGYAQTKYQQLLGCSNVNLTNTTNLYARYTSTVLCNAIVQNSLGPCGLSGNAARPVCAETCAEFATSEEQIASTSDLCGTTGNNAIQQIRADFTNCALPADSLSGQCIVGVQNEPDNCGFASNLPSLCSYCARSSPNATDSCCIGAKAETRCTNVKLPITTSMGDITSSATSSSTASAAAGNGSGGSGLSGGAIAGIVIGSIFGALLLLALIIGCCILFRRRRHSQAGSMLNQPSPTRRAASSMMYAGPRHHGASEGLPVGARVHHLSALEGPGSSESSPMAGREPKGGAFDITPDSQRSGLGVGAISKRGASLSADDSSPNTADYSSPEGAISGDSEAMSHFKDYYSQDDIRSGDAVATLWAYQPRAQDEWELERGDMIKVIGIWDDGWATGVKITERAEDWLGRNENRDSGVSNGSRALATMDEPEAEIKAFPLVCVCLPQHWRKIVDGDVTGGLGPPPPPGSGTP